MRHAIPLATAALAGAGLLAATLPSGAQDAPQGRPHNIAQTFRQQCSSCHTVPDTEFATDRAWLDQVNRTS